MAFQLLTIGDASYDVFLTPSESESMCQLNNRESLICFNYGDKIPVKEIEFTIGGNAANNAVGVKRLGVEVGIVLTLGSDELGERIIKKLSSEGVDTTYVITQTAAFSNYSTIVNYQGERTIFAYKAPRSYEFPVKLPVTPWIYLTSMGDTFQPFYNHLVDFLNEHPDIKLAYNPGGRQIRAGYETLKNILVKTDIIFVNREEAEMLTSSPSSMGKEKELLLALTKLGIKHPIITDGNNGSFVYNGQSFLKCGVLPVDAYERTGAGDAFGSGTLAALIQGKTFDEALVWGTVNSASVIGYTGAQKGLLKQDDMHVWAERARSSGVKVEEF